MFKDGNIMIPAAPLLLVMLLLGMVLGAVLALFTAYLAERRSAGQALPGR